MKFRNARFSTRWLPEFDIHVRNLREVVQQHVPDGLEHLRAPALQYLLDGIAMLAVDKPLAIAQPDLKMRRAIRVVLHNRTGNE
jgi:hypothetical protein